MKRFLYKHLKKYPHLLESDILLWNRFISKYPEYFDRCDYDIHVGSGMEPDPAWSVEIARMAKHLTQWRIDVVGWNDDLPTIVEIKPMAATAAIGQLIVYHHHFIKTYPQFSTPKKLLISDSVKCDIYEVAFTQSIKIILV